MTKDQRARRSVPEYSPNADRFRKEVSRETGNEKMRGPQRPPEEPRRKRIAGLVKNEDLWSMRSDDSDRPGDKRWKSAKEESDDLKDVESISDVNSPKRGTVGDDRCSSGTELDAIKAMCAKREYDDYFHREKNGLGSRRIGEEGLGGSSKKETADCGNRNEEGNKENGVKNVLGVEIEEEGCIVASEFRVDPKPVANLNKSGKNPFGETHRTWASRLINSGGGGFGLEIRKSRR
ncbi:hypothetical protein V6N11_000878 [Hibiscus sabdariffa]|uniref:Uncharacterized protein n=1 Tax=Hibiscus sabdariffa TaxID=183260 RepID=A0ABR2RY15_9ROSI